MKIKTTTKKNYIIPTLIGLVILVAASAYGVYAYTNKSWPFSNTTGTSTDTPGSVINLDPPTQEEIDASQDAKKRLDEQNQNDSQSSGSKQTVDVGIAFADVRGSNLEVRAFTNGVISGDGTCTAQIRRDQTVIERTAPAFIDVASTQCEPMSIPVSELSSGTWTVSVTFNSPSAQGTSENVEVEV